MKKLWRKVLAVALVGVVAGSVGCKDYDDDIDQLNNRLDELTTGKIATLESQLSSLQTSVDNLKSADDALGKRIDELKSDLGKRIDDLKSDATAMGSQLSSLQASVNSLNSADDALGKRIDDLQTELGKQIGDLQDDVEANATEIAALKKAQEKLQEIDAVATDVEELKAAQKQLQKDIDAIEQDLADNYATKDYLQTTLASYATTKSVGDAVAAVTNNLGKFTSEKAIQDAIDAAKEAAITAAGEACKAAFNTSFQAAVAAAGLVNGSDLEQQIEDYDAEIKEYLTKAVNEEDGFINQAIATAIGDAVEKLQAMISGRLTSVQLIPELYNKGIEAIELKSLSYKAWTVNAATETATQGTATSTTAASATSVRYHVNPSVVTKEDVKDPSFVFEKAETRAAVSNELLSVASWNIANGVLTVDVKKVAGTALTLDANHVYTAALKVPLADKYLGKGETGTAVYSDYAALIESVIEPKIAALIDKNSAKTTDKFECDKPGGHYHFSADYTAAQAANPSITKEYNKPIDLLPMVTGCYVEGGTAKEITKEALKAAGLEFRFAVPTKSYTEGSNLTDQQLFASVTNTDGAWTLTSKLPNGTSNNQAAIDKTPIVRVELVDVNNRDAIVDVRYFKVRWVRKQIDPADLGVLKTFEYTLNCNNFDGKFTWKDMVNEVLGRLANGEGMSQDEFLATYDVPEIDATDHTKGTVADAAGAGVELVYNFDNSFDESAAAFTWTLTPEQIGTVIDKLQAGQEVKKVVNVTIPAKNAYQGKLTFSFVVKIKQPKLPAIYGFDSAFWHTDYSLAYVYPVQYNTPTATSECEYNYELDRLFVESKPVTNMLPCYKWDIQFAKAQPATGYAPALTGSKEPAVDGDVTGYTLKKGTEDAVTLTYAASPNWYAPATSNAGAVNVADAADITVSVKETAAGKGILGKEATLKVWAAINPHNRIELTNFNVYFVEPLKINTELTDAYFVDQLISGSEVDCSKAFTMTDFKDYIVAKVTTGTSEEEKYAADLWNYYRVTATTWDLANAKTNLKKDASGNYVVDDTLTAANATVLTQDRFGKNCITPDNPVNPTTLTFKNVSGVKVEKTVKLFIPVTVEHKWGTMTAYVTIELRPEA